MEIMLLVMILNEFISKKVLAIISAFPSRNIEYKQLSLNKPSLKGCSDSLLSNLSVQVASKKKIMKPVLYIPLCLSRKPIGFYTRSCLITGLKNRWSDFQ